MIKIHECKACGRSFGKEDTATRREAPGTKGLSGHFHFCTSLATKKQSKGKQGVANGLSKADGERILAVLAGIRTDVAALQKKAQKKAPKVAGNATTQA